MMADGQVSVGGALSYAWTLLSQNWRLLWGALALNALSWTVLVAGMLAANPVLQLAGFLGMLLTKYPVYGAVARVAAASEGPPLEGSPLGHHGIQWRGLELRMFAADLLASVFVTAMFLLAGLALFAPVLGVIMNTGGDLSTVRSQADIARLLGAHGMTIVQVENLILYMVVMFVAIRLSLALVASAVSGRLVVLSTWRLTRGQFWRIFGAAFVVGLPLILALGVTGAGASGSMAAVTQNEIFVYALLTGVLAGAATTPLMAGLQLYFYRRLGPVPPREEREPKA